MSVLSRQRPCVSEGSAAGSGRSWPWETGGRAAAGSARGGPAVRGLEGHCPRPGGREGNGRLPSPRRGLSSRARGQLADKVPEKTRGNREPLRGPRQGPWGAGPRRLEGGVTSAWQGAHTSRQPDQLQGGAALLPPRRSASGTPPRSLRDGGARLRVASPSWGAAAVAPPLSGALRCPGAGAAGWSGVWDVLWGQALTSPTAVSLQQRERERDQGFRVRPRRGRPCGRGRGHRGDGACLEEAALRAGGRGLRSEPCWAARGGRWPWPWQRRRQEEKPQRGGLGGARPRPPGPSPRAWEAMKLRNGRDRARRDHRGSAVGGGGAAALQSLAGCFWPLMCPGASLVGLCFPPLMAFGPRGTPGPRLGHSPGDTRE